MQPAAEDGAAATQPRRPLVPICRPTRRSSPAPNASRSQVPAARIAASKQRCAHHAGAASLGSKSAAIAARAAPRCGLRPAAPQTRAEAQRQWFSSGAGAKPKPFRHFRARRSRPAPFLHRRPGPVVVAEPPPLVSSEPICPRRWRAEVAAQPPVPSSQDRVIAASVVIIVLGARKPRSAVHAGECAERPPWPSPPNRATRSVGALDRRRVRCRRPAPNKRLHQRHARSAPAPVPHRAISRSMFGTKPW